MQRVQSLSFGPMSPLPVALVSLGVEVAPQGELLPVGELLELLAVAATLPSRPLDLQ